jgi:potassium-transporting ATPase KdpC subunit
MNSMLRPCVVLFAALSIVTGIAYPLVVTGIGQAVFADQAAGSLVVRDGKAIGSALIAQGFTGNAHFWSRPSATGPHPYNAAHSGGSNLGPLNPALVDAVKARIAALKAADPGNTLAVPVDLVTASASGLDPDISLAAAHYQVARVARASGLPLAVVQGLINANAQGSLLGFIGEPRVNVLALNLALDADLAKAKAKAPAQ